TRCFQILVNRKNKVIDPWISLVVIFICDMSVFFDRVLSTKSQIVYSSGLKMNRVGTWMLFCYRECYGLGSFVILPKAWIQHLICP
ncbi:MAG: hypothetical protein WD595_03520, partial [Waddliaceae bacterium]